MFQQIESNKRMSAVLVIVVTALLIVLGWVIGAAFGAPWYTAVPAALVVAVAYGCLSYYAGGKMILALSKARKIDKPDNPQLFNVVEEMAIAAGVPMPEVYVIDDPAPNAFATGRKPEEAAIAVTTGLLEKLNRDELQGVIAHEMSHIRNYDILFMTLMAALVGAIALLADVFLRSTWYGPRRFRSRDSQASGIFMLIALVLAIIAPLIGMLIQLAASRRREFLADASGALLTRYPAGLASALRKIASDPTPLQVASRATQHMYIVNPLKGMERRVQSLFSTHPPIEERIARLERMAFMDTTGEELPAAAGDGTAVPLTPAVPAAPGSVLPQAALVGGGLAAGESTARRQLPGACPRCSEPLVPVKVKGHKLQACKACGGVWIDSRSLAELLRSDPRRLGAVDARFPNLVGGLEPCGAETLPAM